jgi:hypothetical protein
MDSIFGAKGFQGMRPQSLYIKDHPLWLLSVVILGFVQMLNDGVKVFFIRYLAVQYDIEQAIRQICSALLALQSLVVRFVGALCLMHSV